MKVAVLQSNYVPWKGYFDLIHDADLFIFYDEVKYTKNDWRNRNKIYTKNGLQWLSIPVDAHFVNQKISDVTFRNDTWQELHYKSLSFGYRSAPHYHQLDDLIGDYLVKQKWSHLKDLNQYLIKTISEKIGIKTGFIDSTAFNLEGDRIQRLLNLLLQAKATEYISGPSAKGYMEPHLDLFRNNNIKVTFKEYPEYKTYKQLSAPFEQYVSILDMVAHLQWNQIGNYIWNNETNTL